MFILNIKCSVLVKHNLIKPIKAQKMLGSSHFWSVLVHFIVYFISCLMSCHDTVNDIEVI